MIDVMKAGYMKAMDAMGDALTCQISLTTEILIVLHVLFSCRCLSLRHLQAVLTRRIAALQGLRKGQAS